MANTISFSGYLSNSIENAAINLLVYPLAVDYLGTVPPNPATEAYMIKGNAVVSNINGTVDYGSENRASTAYFLGNALFMKNDKTVSLLPFHTQFAYTQEQGSGIMQGDNVPILVAARTRTNTFSSLYRGNYGENRESDFPSVQVEAKWNGGELCTGDYMEFRLQSLPYSGDVEIKLTNTNNTVDVIPGVNTTTIKYNADDVDNGLPTLQHLQFRNTNGNLSHTFSTADEGNVRIAAGDFKSNPDDIYFDYVEGNSVEFSYSVHGENEWKSLEITDNPEYFMLPGFGNYYEASLAEVNVPQENSWFDVKLVSTNASGNSQEQIISPAFKIEQKSLATANAAIPTLSVYPNPFTNEINIKTPANSTGNYVVTITDITGKNISTQQIPADKTFTLNTISLVKGVYLISVQNNCKTVVKKVIKK